MFVFDNELWCMHKVIRIMMMSRIPIYLPLVLLHVVVLNYLNIMVNMLNLPLVLLLLG